MPVAPWEARFPRWGRDSPLALSEERGPFSQLLNLVRVWLGLPQAWGDQRLVRGLFLAVCSFFRLKSHCVTLKLL